jgi:FkbM family methyltransferase
MTNLPPVSKPPISFRLLSKLTKIIPAIPHASGLSNRIVKPIFCSLHHEERYCVEAWEGIRMIVDPADCIGGNLAFIPQLFDVWERAAVDKFLPRGGVFIDVGANIGAYSLWAAKRVGPTGRVLAYEAEPMNFSVLQENIAINRLERIIQAHRIGVSDTTESLTLRLNDGGNSGGHSFISSAPSDRVTSITVECKSLAKLIDEANIQRVDFMKMDIEGFEQRVLSQFFSDVQVGSPLRPRVLLTEMYFASKKKPDRLLLSTIEQAGYKLRGYNGYNYLFVRQDL